MSGVVRVVCRCDMCVAQCAATRLVQTELYKPNRVQLQATPIPTLQYTALKLYHYSKCSILILVDCRVLLAAPVGRFGFICVLGVFAILELCSAQCSPGSTRGTGVLRTRPTRNSVADTALRYGYGFTMALLALFLLRLQYTART